MKCIVSVYINNVESRQYDYCIREENNKKSYKIVYEDIVNLLKITKLPITPCEHDSKKPDYEFEIDIKTGDDNGSKLVVVYIPKEDAVLEEHILTIACDKVAKIVNVETQNEKLNTNSKNIEDICDFLNVLFMYGMYGMASEPDITSPEDEKLLEQAEKAEKEKLKIKKKTYA